jgi:hypothetical protein
VLVAGYLVEGTDPVGMLGPVVVLLQALGLNCADCDVAVAANPDAGASPTDGAKSGCFVVICNAVYDDPTPLYAPDIPRSTHEGRVEVLALE